MCKYTFTSVTDKKSKENIIRYSQCQQMANITTISLFDNNWRFCDVLLIRATVTSANGRGTLNDEQKEHVRNLPVKRLGAAGNLFASSTITSST